VRVLCAADVGAAPPLFSLLPRYEVHGSHPKLSSPRAQRGQVSAVSFPTRVPHMEWLIKFGVLKPLHDRALGRPVWSYEVLTACPRPLAAVSCTEAATNRHGPTCSPPLCSKECSFCLFFFRRGAARECHAGWARLARRRACPHLRPCWWEQ